MNRMLSITYPSLVFVAVLMVIWMAAWSPSARCANTKDGVWVSGVSRCYRLTDFMPASALEPAR